MNVDLGVQRKAYKWASIITDVKENLNRQNTVAVMKMDLLPRILLA